MISAKYLRREMAWAAGVNLVIAAALLTGCVKSYLTPLASLNDTTITVELYGSLLAITKTLLLVILPVMCAFCAFVSTRILVWRRQVSD